MLDHFPLSKLELLGRKFHGGEKKSKMSVEDPGVKDQAQFHLQWGQPF